MTRWYICTLLSDVIVKESSATESVVRTLDYLPGSQFRGIVAQSYKKFDEPFEIFHSGSVRFSDATPELDGVRTIPIPASWWYKKNSGGKIILRNGHSAINKETVRNTAINDPSDSISVQYKAYKSGFINTATLEITSTYSSLHLKSARDSKDDRSAEGQLFAYEALLPGTKYIFSIDTENISLLDKIEKELIGIRHIGRSRTAEFGEVDIKRYNDFIKQDQHELVDFEGEKYIILYAESDLCIIDKIRPLYRIAITDRFFIPSRCYRIRVRKAIYSNKVLFNMERY